LAAARITSGKLDNAQPSANLVLLDGTNIFTGSNNFIGVVIATNDNNILKGTLSGNVTGNLAGNATTATTANNFSGSLAGDVTGTQGATVVADVGGQTAAN